jgi:hypothetical protein
MDADRSVSELLYRAVVTLEPRVDVLVSGGAERGRRLRRRRRIAQVGSGLALAALITTVTVAVWPSAGSAGQRGVAAHRTSAAQPPVKVPSRTQQADDSVTMTPQLLLQRTLDLLPRKPDTRRYTGRAFTGWIGAEFIYDDGNGAAQIYVSMGFTEDGLHAAQPPCQPSNPGCRVLSDGSHLQVFRGPEYSQGHLPYNATEWSIDLVRADGVEVSMSEWNSTQEKDAPITRAEPPFSIAQLTAIARSDAFSPEVSSADADQAANLFVPDRTDEVATTNSTQQARGGARAERRAAKAAKLAYQNRVHQH